MLTIRYQNARARPIDSNFFFIFLFADSWSAYTGAIMRDKISSISAPSSKLLRALGPWMATAVVAGTVIGSGVFKKPQVVSEQLPFSGLAAIVWILGGVLAFLGGLSLAEVAVLFPKAGGNYVFLREGYGRLAGFLFGWVEFWIIRSASVAALATIFTESFHDMLSEVSRSLGYSTIAAAVGYWPQKFITVIVITGLAWVNIRGVRWGGGLQFFITSIKVASLLGIMALPFVVAAVVTSPDVPRPDVTRLEPVWPAAGGFSLGHFATAFLGVLWAYHGWMNIAPVAEEVRNPNRNIPRSLFSGIGIVMFLYLGANVAYYLIIPQPEMALMKAPESSGLDAYGQQSVGVEDAVHDKTVAIGFCRRLLGSVGVAVAAAAVMISVFGALNGNLLVGPRLLYAMGEDGLAPRALGAVHSGFRTPALAILVLAVWSCLLVLGVAFLTWCGILPRGKDHFDRLTDFAMFGSVVFETLAITTIFVFRRQLPNVERPYRCWGYPVVPALYLILPAMVLGNMFFNQQFEAMTGVGFIALGATVYFVTGISKR
jgi:amino acid transporter